MQFNGDNRANFPDYFFDIAGNGFAEDAPGKKQAAQGIRDVLPAPNERDRVGTLPLAQKLMAPMASAYQK
jgi:hypothetical protein